MANQSGTRTVRLALSGLMLTLLFALSASAQGRRNVGGITVFTNPNFSGQSASFRTDMPDLRGYGLNDKISSLEITGGESWEVCQDINYANRCQVFSSSVSNLSSMGWNDRISSLRRVNGGYNGRRENGQNGVFFPNSQNGVFLPNGSNRSQGLVLYDRPNFRGNSIIVNNGERGNLGNSLGSAQVRWGVWQLCDRTGRCATVSQDVSDLSRLGLRGRVTSARLLNDGARGNSDRRWGRY